MILGHRFRCMLTKTLTIICLLFVFGVLPASADNVVIDHANWGWYDSQSPTAAAAVGSQKVYFAHASVGGNILAGFSALHAADAVKYPLTQSGVGDTPPSTTTNGVIYEYARGNPGWSAKINTFETYVANGWHDPKTNWAMNKFCYIDQDAVWPNYRDSMAALEAAHPGTRFVYWTMPLTTGSDAGAVQRALFNQSLRTWIASQDQKLLFDLADIEAWDPSGNHQTFMYNGTAYEQLYTGYTSDGGHLNAVGSQRAATGLYSLFGMALAAPEPVPTGTATRLATATLTPDLARANLENNLVLACPNPAQDLMTFVFHLDAAAKVVIHLYNLAGEQVASLGADFAAGRGQSLRWDCSDAAPGVYVARVLKDGKEAGKLKVAVVK